MVGFKWALNVVMKFFAIAFIALMGAFFSSGAQQLPISDDSIQAIIAKELMSYKMIDNRGDEDRKDGTPRKEVHCSFIKLSNLAKAAEILSEIEAFYCLDTSLGALELPSEYLIKKFEELHLEANRSIKLEPSNSGQISTFLVAELR